MNILIGLVGVLPAVVVGLLLPILGRQRRGLLFGVTVSLDFAESAEAKAAVRRYALRSLASASVILVMALVAVLLGKALLPLFSAIAIPAELLTGFALWQGERRGMKAHAVKVPLQRSADLSPRHVGGIYAGLAALLPMALEAVWLRSRWNEIPARWPQHWDAYGHANVWGTRTFGGVFEPLVMGACIVLAMTGLSAFIALGPGPQSRQRRLALAPLAGLNWLLAGVFCLIGLLPMRQNVSVETVVAVSVVDMIATLGVVVWLIVRSGFINPSKSMEPYDGTPDAMWHAGIFYYNPGDAAVIVPKRYGFGWTLNMARPAAWAYLGGVVMVVVVAGVLPKLLGK